MKKIKKLKTKGFSLVELIVAMALTSMLALMAYGLFGVSSQNLVEVDSLEATSARGRFAIERIRYLLQGAGSLGTPDNKTDPFFKLNQNIRVAGVMSYDRWQNVPLIGGTNTHLSRDGIVLIGAYDFPMNFQAGGFEAGSTGQMVIGGDYLGMEKLYRANPFADVQSNPANPDQYMPVLDKRDWSVGTNYDFLGKGVVNSRLIRITDPLGYNQFLRPNYPTVPVNFGTMLTPVNQGLRVPLDVSNEFKPLYKRDRPTTDDKTLIGEIGLDLASVGEGDKTYEAAFLDAYWLHVIPATHGDNANMMLVLDRVCAGDIVKIAAADAGNLTEGQLDTARSSCGLTPQRTMITDRVVDFQIWFDCVDPAGTFAGTWSKDWVAPDNSGSCMDMDSFGTYSPGAVRVAHSRLTLRTDEERKNFRHDPFVTPAGDTCTPFTCPTATLRSFDINPDLEGAAPVVTFQTDIALKNFIIKDLK